MKFLSDLQNKRRQLNSELESLYSQLIHLQGELDLIQDEIDHKITIQHDYHLNDIEDTISYDYKKLYLMLRDSILADEVLDDADLNYWQKYIQSIESTYSTNHGKDPYKLYPCPNCGESNIWIVDNFEIDGSTQYAVHCRNCHFVGPTSLEYLGVWDKFRCWLEENGYLKSDVDI